MLWHRVAPVAVSEGEARAFRKRVATRLELDGGTIVVRAGSSVAASFDPLELEDVIELALGLLADARAEAPRLEVACGLSVGELNEAGGEAEGTLIDRAQLLAAGALPLELVLDEVAHDRAKDTHLFTRPVLVGPVAGYALDARHPKKNECRDALIALRPAPLPTGEQATFERLQALATASGTHRIALCAQHPHAGLDMLERLRERLNPALVLHVGSQAASLQPLGGLQLALGRARTQLGGSLDAALVRTLNRLKEGEALTHEEAVAALQELLRATSANHRHIWLVLDRPLEIDAASLAVMSEAIADTEAEHVLFLLASDAKNAPAALLSTGPWESVVLEPLSEPDRAHVAGAALCLTPSSELARRVALIGGETACGIMEAARTLVCSGDIVLDEGAFRFRAQPRHASMPIPLEALLTERAAGLEPSAHRVLEALCLSPPSASFEFVERITALDGLGADAAASGLGQLTREGWLDDRYSLGPLEQAVRSAVRNSMPPSRAAELHRFVADVLRQAPALSKKPCFSHALLAHHLVEGGREQEAAVAFLDAAQAASDAGFSRMAVRLAALALKQDGSSELRERARRIAGAVDAHASPTTATAAGALHANADIGEHTRASDPRQLASTAIQAAISAIVRGEPDAAEGLIDTAVAAGFGRAAAQRLWSMAELERGDVPGAVRALKDAHLPAGTPGTRSREAIAAALILLESGEKLDAVRAGLDALASSRRAHDTRGEHVALHVLSSCYHALGREPDAERLADAAATAQP